MSFGEVKLQPPQGWQCPACTRVYAPFIPQCFSCGPDKPVQSVQITIPSPSEIERNQT